MGDSRHRVLGALDGSDNIEAGSVHGRRVNGRAVAEGLGGSIEAYH